MRSRDFLGNIHPPISLKDQLVSTKSVSAEPHLIAGVKLDDWLDFFIFYKVFWDVGGQGSIVEGVE